MAKKKQKVKTDVEPAIDGLKIKLSQKARKPIISKRCQEKAGSLRCASVSLWNHGLTRNGSLVSLKL